MKFSADSRVARYGAAIAAVAIALAISVSFRAVFEENPFLLFWAAIAVTAWFGGLGPSLVAIVLTMVLVNYFLIAPYNAFALEPMLLIRFSIFLLVAALISFLYEGKRRTETALSASRLQFEAILTGITDGVTAQEPGGGLIFANTAAAQIIGFPTTQSLIAAPVAEVAARFELFDEGGKPIPVSELPGRIALQGKQPPDKIVRFRIRATGVERWSIVKATPVYDPQRNLHIAINLFQDITEFKQAEKTLYDEREWFRTTLSAIGDGVIATDTEQNIVFINPVAEALTGWRSYEALGQHINDVFVVINETAREPVDNPLVRVLAEGTIVGLANHSLLIARDGTELPIDDSGSPIRSATGAITGAVLVFRDVTERRRSEEGLAQTNQTLQALIDAAPLAVIVFDMEGIVSIWSPAAERIFGWTSEEAVGRYLPTIDSSSRPQFQQTLESAARGETLTGMEANRVRKDGAPLRIRFSTSPLRNSNGVVTHLIKIAEDITRDAQTEVTQKFLTEAGALLASSLDYETTLANIANLATPEIADWCAIDMLTEDEDIRRVAVAHVDPEKVRWAYELQKRYPVDVNAPTGVPNVLRTGQSEFYGEIDEEMIVKSAKDDEQAQIIRDIGFRSAMVIPLNARGRTVGAITLVTTRDSNRIFEDTDLALAEELGRRAALAVDNARLYRLAQQERERLRVTLASIGDAVIVTDGDGNVTFMNAVAQNLTAWSEMDAIGVPLDRVFNIVNEETRATVESPVTKVIREGQIVGLANHTILIARDRKEVPIDDSGAPIRDDNGAITGVVLVFRDITERKQVEQERAALLLEEQAARAAAEAANDLKLKFLAMISHELRTPLTSIKGFTSTLLAPDVNWDSTTEREFISIMDEEADKLADLVEQLLDVSRLQAGTLRIDPEQHRFQEILDIAMVQMQTVSAGHQFVLDIEPDLPPVIADNQRMAQVLVNLVDNAVKYSPLDSRILLRAQRRSSMVEIIVSDEGDGIAPEDREYVFEAFRQLERKPGRQKGAGLGLAICKGLIEAHGGRIWISDNTPRGTNITFTLPIAAASPSSPTA